MNEETATQALLMGVAGEVFALDARQVREILDPAPVTRVPGAKPYVASVLNVRGKVIPLADLSVRLGLAPSRVTAETRFVVLEVELDGQPTAVGVIADKVFEVTEIDPASMQRTPPVGMHWRPEFIAAIAKWKDEFIVVPDMARILGDDAD
jgi:purine-binding chemotaxis protein CheW